MLYYSPDTTGFPPPPPPQGLSFHLGAVLLSLGFITYVEHGRNHRLITHLLNSDMKIIVDDEFAVLLYYGHTM